MNNNIAILGASPKPERYSNVVQKLFIKNGYNVFPINPNYNEIDNIICYKNISDIEPEIHTLTIYMKPGKTEKIFNGILNKKPKRVIFNPGSESAALKNKLQTRGIEVLEACTIVLLKTGQF